MLADMSASEQHLSTAIEDADRLISKLEALAVEHRPRSLRSASGLCAAAVMALGDEATDQKLEYYEQVFGWMESEANLRDPEFRAISYAVSIAENLVRQISEREVDTAFTVLHRAYRLLDLVEFEHGATVETERFRRRLENSARPLESLRIQESLVGNPAPPLACEAVVHEGRIDRSGLSWQDLRGKVVMLEFWNVRCGPCIRGFPKLAELETEFGRRGFLVLGQTHFYGMRWDDQLGAPVSDEQASVDQELAMLAQFAQKWKAKHRLLATSDHGIDSRYGVSANPTAFLVDRQGKVRMAAVGSDEIDAPEFREMLLQLLEE